MDNARVMAKSRTMQTVSDDRKAVKTDEEKAAEALFWLVRKARFELSAPLFNDWRYAIGMYGHPIQRLRAAEAIYPLALGEMNSEGI